MFARRTNAFSAVRVSFVRVRVVRFRFRFRVRFRVRVTIFCAFKTMCKVREEYTTIPTPDHTKCDHSNNHSCIFIQER